MALHVFITGESLHCFLVGWCTNKSYVIAASDLWLFIHASNLFPSFPTPLPCKSWCCEQDGSSRGPDHRASPTLMADLQLQQQDPVLRPVLAASTTKLSNMKERSTRALEQQYPRRFLKNGILCRGQADHRRGALQQLVLPSSLRPDVPREVRVYISSCERCTVVQCFREREGDMILGIVVR